MVRLPSSKCQTVQKLEEHSMRKTPNPLVSVWSHSKPVGRRISSLSLGVPIRVSLRPLHFQCLLSILHVVRQSKEGGLKKKYPGRSRWALDLSQ